MDKLFHGHAAIYVIYSSWCKFFPRAKWSQRPVTAEKVVAAQLHVPRKAWHAALLWAVYLWDWEDVPLTLHRSCDKLSGLIIIFLFAATCTLITSAMCLFPNCVYQILLALFQNNLPAYVEFHVSNPSTNFMSAPAVWLLLCEGQPQFQVVHRPVAYFCATKLVYRLCPYVLLHATDI